MMVVMRMTMIMVLLMLMWVVSVRTIYDCQDCDAYRSQDSYSVQFRNVVVAAVWPAVCRGIPSVGLPGPIVRV